MIKQYFKFKEHNTSYYQEWLGALTTFATTAYVIVVNPTILSEAGIDFGSAMTATIIVICLASICMGLLSNCPIVVAPGMGVSTYFTYFIVLKKGLSWQVGLGCIFISAVIIVFLSLFRVRQKMLSKMPPILTYSSIAGIGLFLVIIGLKSAGVLVCQNHLQIGTILSLEALFTLISLGFIAVCMRYRIQGSFILAILLNWALSLFFGLSVWQGCIHAPPSLLPTLGQLDLIHIWTPQVFSIILSLFLVSLFDSSASLLTMLRILQKPFSQDVRPVLSDGLFSMLAAFLGIGSLAYHLESIAGIQAGARTGLSMIFVGFLFLLCLFFHPIISSIPHFASAAILIVLGGSMVMEIRYIKTKDVTEWIVVMVTMFTMPLTFSVYKGFAFGFITYTLFKLLLGKIQQVHWAVIVLSILFVLQIALVG